MTTWTLNQNNLTKFLTHAQLEPSLERESGLIDITVPAGEHELPLFFVIRNEGEVLQLVCYFPYQIQQGQRDATARLLHLVNRDIDIPGFGMDEEQNIIFYRLVIPCLKGEINEDLLRVYIDTIKLICDSFFHAIGLISTGNMDLDELKKQASSENNHPH